MTFTEWNDLRARTEAALNVDVKEYNSLVDLFAEWTCSASAIEQYRRGEPVRYIERLRDVLRRLKSRETYPCLVDTGTVKKEIRIGTVPSSISSQMPEAKPKPKQKIPVPEGWARFSKFENYASKLSDSLRREGEQNLVAWMANRSRLHETAKELQRSNASKTALADVIKQLDEQELCIQNYFDRVQKYMNGETSDEVHIGKDSKPSGKYTKAQIDNMTNLEFAAECKILRKEANIRYINRKDLTTKPELELRKQELREWGIDVDNSLKRKV